MKERTEGGREGGGEGRNISLRKNWDMQKEIALGPNTKLVDEKREKGNLGVVVEEVTALGQESSFSLN